MLLFKTISVLPKRSTMLKNSMFHFSKVSSFFDSSVYSLTIDAVANAIGITSSKIRSMGPHEYKNGGCLIKFKPSFRNFNYIDNELSHILNCNDIEHTYYRNLAPEELYIKPEGINDFIFFVNKTMEKTRKESCDEPVALLDSRQHKLLELVGNEETPLLK